MAAPLPDQVHENIAAVAELRAQVASEVARHERRLYRVAAFLSQPRTFYVLFSAVTIWIVLNAVMIARHATPFDAPPFFWLQGSLALYAGLVSTLVLIRQAGQSRDDERRAHLEFHVNLLAEQKATKIIALLEELRRDLPNVKDRTDAVADQMQTAVDPQLVDTAIRK
jgi:uncharacterized membrane protein